MTEEEMRKIADMVVKDLLNRKNLVHEEDIISKAIKQRHIDGYIIFRGNSSKLPTNGTREIQVYYEENTKKLKIWNTVNGAWEEVSLT